MSHAGFLRTEGEIPKASIVALVRKLSTSVRAPLAPDDDVITVAMQDLAAFFTETTADPFDAGDRAILQFLPRVVLAPRGCTREDLDGLRRAGFDERALHDIVQVACCFSYMNRLADSLGVGILESSREWAIDLFGEEAYEAHVAWAAPG